MAPAILNSFKGIVGDSHPSTMPECCVCLPICRILLCDSPAAPHLQGHLVVFLMYSYR